MLECRENEQYFFDRTTVVEIADRLSTFARPCVLCAPKVGEELAIRGIKVTILDIDERFALLPGYSHWDISRPKRLEQNFDVVFCDPPFFNVSLKIIREAARILVHYDTTRPIAIAYLSRRATAICRAFSEFKLQRTGFLPTYESVETSYRNRIELFANFDWDNSSSE